MTRQEALNICEKALRKHEGGREAFLSILNDLMELNEYKEYDEEDEDDD